MSIQYDVKDLGLADAGRDSIEWADRQMPVLSLIRERFVREQPLKGVEAQTKSRKKIRGHIEEFELHSGRSLYILGEGRLVNLAAAEGQPPAVMDMSFANQALCAEYMMQNAKSLEKKVYSVPLPIDQEIARLKLVSMGVNLDKLTAKQEKYLASWEEGT